MWCQIRKCCGAHPLPVIKSLATQRGQGEEKGGCLPHGPRVVHNCVQLAPLHHRLSPVPPLGSQPRRGLAFTLRRSLVYLPPYLVFRLPGVLATGQLVTSPCSVIKSPVHHQHGCLGKLSHSAFGCVQEKQESLVVLFLPLCFNAIQVWRFPQTGKCLPFKSPLDANNQLALKPAVTLSLDLKLGIFF